MKRTHASILALALAVAVVAGSFAALRTTQLRANATPRVDATQIARQNRALDRAQAALRAELKHKPPAISALHQAPRAAAQTVIYHRPPPVVHVIHRAGGAEHDDRGDGGGLDD